MPRRKIGADLKEALCKLYEAGDISADTIEKHGIMSRATFFRNLKMYKTGASLEQRHSTGRKTNADKLKEQERKELDALHPMHLSHLELVLLLDEDDKTAQALATRNKRKAKGPLGVSKRKDAVKGQAGDEQNNDVAEIADDSASESDADIDDSVALAKRQELDHLLQSVRSFLATSSSGISENLGVSHASDGASDLHSLSKPEDSHYSHSNRGALFVVRRRSQSKGGQSQEIVAAVAIRSLIWTPEIYQALGSSYASRSIDKICNLTRLRVDSSWQRRGIGRWLVRVAELKASKLGFAQLYTQADATTAELLSFWKSTDFNEFARFNDVARLEKTVNASQVPSKAEGSKRVSSRSPPVLPRTDGDIDELGSNSTLKKRRLDDKLSDGGEADSLRRPQVPQELPIDPAIPLDLSAPMVSTTLPTSHNPSPIAGEPPRRRIAFHDTSSSESRSSS